MSEDREVRTSGKVRKWFRNAAFLVVSSLPIVVCSEKTFWYPQGFEVFAIALFYASAVLLGLWAIQYYRVRRFAPLFLCASLFGILVEGVITPIVYEGGPFDPLMVIWTSIAWHAMLSFVLCWYLFRKWLLERRMGRLAVACVLYGVFLGSWSLTYYLPEVAFLGEEHLDALGEELGAQFEETVEGDGDVQAFMGQVTEEQRTIMEAALASHVWPAKQYAIWAFLMGLWIAGSHYVLGWLWPKEFRPGWILTGLALILLFLFALNWLPGIPWAPVKLAVVLAIILVPLRQNKKREEDPTVFEELHGKVKLWQLLPVFLISAVASIIYWYHTVNPFPEEFIRAWCYRGWINLLIAVGAGMFLWAIYRTLRPAAKST